MLDDVVKDEKRIIVRHKMPDIPAKNNHVRNQDSCSCLDRADGSGTQEKRSLQDRFGSCMLVPDMNDSQYSMLAIMLVWRS